MPCLLVSKCGGSDEGSQTGVSSGECDKEVLSQMKMEAEISLWLAYPGVTHSPPWDGFSFVLSVSQTEFSFPYIRTCTHTAQKRIKGSCDSQSEISAVPVAHIVLPSNK